MPITFTDWSYGNTIGYSYDEELARWDTNVNSMAVGELILNDIILVSARNVADIEDRSGQAIVFGDKRYGGVEFDADYILFDSDSISFDDDGALGNFTDNIFN